jgi:hypothetical protein
MSEDWQEKLRKLHDRLLTEELRSPQVGGAGGLKKTSSPSRPSQGIHRLLEAKAPAIDAILGLDFGTRFTKVAVFLPHINRREILGLGHKAERVVPSRVVLGDNERLYSITCMPDTKPKMVIEYLKNGLASPGAEAFGASFHVGNIPLDRIIKATCAYYLADILRKAESAARKAFPAELKPQRPINWSANIGVPTKHYDSKMVDIFREVSAVAWMWRSKVGPAPLPPELAAEYEKTAARVQPKDMPIQVAPELTAALVHFAEHRNTAAGVYSFFDIGGGTLDGSVFRLRRERAGPSFDILSANVEELGTMAVTRKIVSHVYRRMVSDVEKPIIFGGPSPIISLAVPTEIEESIQTFFASVIGAAQQRGLFPPSSQPDRRGLNEPIKPVLPVFLAGGGCRSEWYQNLFSRTCQEYGHSAQWGISGYDVKVVPAPANTVDDEYPRFVIALGLTSQTLHFNQYRSPSRYSAVPGLPVRKPSAPDYRDSKDLV